MAIPTEIVCCRRGRIRCGREEEAAGLVWLWLTLCSSVARSFFFRGAIVVDWQCVPRRELTQLEDTL